MKDEKRFIIIDGHAILHRAYHALPPLTTKKGELVSAVYGFLLVFFKAIKELQPDYIVATFDLPGPTFRHKKFEAYKATRPKTPEEFYLQIPRIKEILKSFNVAIFEKEGYEADDLIGTIARLIPKKQALPKINTIILSGDLDVLQLINPQTKVWFLRKGVKDIVLYDEGAVGTRYQGLRPDQLSDYKALRGDPSDNIPGAPGIGEKTAIELLTKFGTIESLYKELELKTEKAKKLKVRIREILIQSKEQVFLSKMLATIDRNVEIDFNLEKYIWSKYDKEKTSQLLKNLEFFSLVSRLP
ncbi:MAG TPA: hypothetical protein ENI19_00905 [Candidatus Nealsonbacteria bacterium]|uniref:5'-3' exonuclease domain-containing protein n=1 Tax=marine sediment metagenome TaxID=412755 RepID=A0A0F9UVM8_9ZZZZ|nr:hypothetical protein [Candidatus Nealsonbacteria bacterium]HEB46251.1 hypothetical protein [Candidatus Nealsonbacteria bacterium]